MTVQRNAGKEHSESNGLGGGTASGNRKLSRQKELESRRLRGEISCAECRRLKLKCDKKIPCTSCMRRGCETICPLGERHAGQSGRLDLAGTSELRQTISEMSNRIRQLEDALQIEHGMRTTEAHPLLTDEFRSMTEDPEHGKSVVGAIPSEEEELQCVMGLLTISDGGVSRYLGATGSDQALLAEVGVSGLKLSDPADVGLNIPEQLAQASQLWPFGVAFGSTIDMHMLIEAQLPSRERASGLGESFVLNTNWCGRPVLREQIMEDLIPAAYKRIPNGHSTRMDLHDLALLYMVFAAGAAADLTLPPYNAEAERYRHLARAALSIKSVFDGGSLSVVQAIFLMGTYDVVSGRINSMESAWKMFCLASSLGASIGLHRDPAQWQLDPKTIYRRRVLFWEMCWVDNWKSLSIGRPISLTLDMIDCEFPEDRDATVLADGTVIPSFWGIKNKFAKEVLSRVAVKLCAARSPKYSEILEIDRLVRDFDMQPVEQCLELSQAIDDSDQQLFNRRFVLAYFRDRVLLYIHRNYFARALSDYPNNPLKSPFSPSFLAAYCSATSLLRALKEDFAKVPHVFLRNWPVWAHALVASVVVGSVAIRSPRIRLACPALAELEQAIKLFKSASGLPVLRQGLPFLMAMHEQAKTARQNAKTSGLMGGIGPKELDRLVNGLGEGAKEKMCAGAIKILMGSMPLALPERKSGTYSQGCSSHSSPDTSIDISAKDPEPLSGPISRQSGTQDDGSNDLASTGSNQTPDSSSFFMATGPSTTPNQTYQATDALPDVETQFFSGFDFSNQEPPNVISNPPDMNSSTDTLLSLQIPGDETPLLNDSSFPPIDSDFFSDFLQPSAPFPPTDVDMGYDGQQSDDIWQSFMSDSGLKTVDELMRSWQV